MNVYFIIKKLRKKHKCQSGAILCKNALITLICIASGRIKPPALPQGHLRGDSEEILSYILIKSACAQ